MTATRIFFAAAAFASLTTAPGAATAQRLPADTPKSFTPVRAAFDFDKREVEIAMRDGVKLHTVIFTPRGLSAPAPLLLTRTPYDADARGRGSSPKLGATLPSADDVVAVSGYIRVYQDVRGKHGSEGDYVVNRPWRGALNPTKTDHSTDTYDTIAWLVKNVRGNNGRVGTIGTSYDGFTTLMSLIGSHPALRAAVPINPMVDGWMGDDWFHGGAFRQTMAPWIYEQTATRKNEEKWWSGTHDDYDRYLRWGSAGAMGREMGMEQLGFWKKLTEHPNYDGWWQAQAVDRKLAAEPLRAAVLMIHGLFDQEDIHGPMRAYQALEAKDANNDRVFLAMGPWAHGGSNRDGRSLGAIRFAGDTGLQFRREVLQPFLDQHLKGGADARLAPVLAYETGADVWHRYDRWAAASATRPYYLRPNGGLGFGQSANVAAPASFVSDPARPVPFIPRPVLGEDNEAWRPWLVSDQRHASARPDVLVFMSEPLTAPLRIAGTPFANLTAATTGEDADWVVKLIDVYPDEVAAQPELGGYQLMVSGDILRGRFRDDPAKPVHAVPGQPHRYRFALPTVHHTFQPGHRVMVQIQSSWFPLYDRNPQTWVENIFFAPASAYKAQTHSVSVSGANASFIELPVVGEAR